VFYAFTPTTCFLEISPQTEVRRTIVTLLDENGNNVTNFGANPITVQVGYDDTQCPGTVFPFTQSIVLGFGQSTAFYQYDYEKSVDCGGVECFLEQRYIDCVLSVTNASLTGSSPISAC
jgi:hypothetical protein